MGRRQDSFVQSTGQYALTMIGDASPVAVVSAPKAGVFFWDQVNNNLYLSEAKGKNNWAWVASAGSVSPSALLQHDYFDATTNQTAFTLSQLPADDSKVIMTVNGVELRNGTHYTVSGTSVTFLPLAAGFAMEASNEFLQPDRIRFEYFV